MVLAKEKQMNLLKKLGFGGGFKDGGFAHNLRPGVAHVREFPERFVPVSGCRPIGAQITIDIDGKGRTRLGSTIRGRFDSSYRISDDADLLKDIPKLLAELREQVAKQEEERPAPAPAATTTATATATASSSFDDAPVDFAKPLVECLAKRHDARAHMRQEGLDKLQALQAAVAKLPPEQAQAAEVIGLLVDVLRGILKTP